MKNIGVKRYVVLGATLVGTLLIIGLVYDKFVRMPLFCNHFSFPNWIENAPVTNTAHDFILYDTRLNLFVYLRGDDPTHPATSSMQFYWLSPNEVRLTAWGHVYMIHSATDRIILIRPGKAEATIPLSAVDAA